MQTQTRLTNQQQGAEYDESKTTPREFTSSDHPSRAASRQDGELRQTSTKKRGEETKWNAEIGFPCLLNLHSPNDVHLIPNPQSVLFAPVQHGNQSNDSLVHTKKAKVPTSQKNRRSRSRSNIAKTYSNQTKPMEFTQTPTPTPTPTRRSRSRSTRHSKRDQNQTTKDKLMPTLSKDNPKEQIH
jgi:hypothetical protein